MRADIRQVYLSETEYKLRPHKLRESPPQRATVKLPRMPVLRVALMDILSPGQLFDLAMLKARLCA